MANADARRDTQRPSTRCCHHTYNRRDAARTPAPCYITNEPMFIANLHIQLAEFPLTHSTVNQRLFI